MEMLAQLSLNPGGVMAWIGVGLIAGWLAGVAMTGEGLGIVADLGLGLIGALIGGIVTSFFMSGDAGFWASMLIAFLGACMVIAAVRLVLPSRTNRI